MLGSEPAARLPQTSFYLISLPGLNGDTIIILHLELVTETPDSAAITAVFLLSPRGTSEGLA